MRHSAFNITAIGNLSVTIAWLNGIYLEIYSLLFHLFEEQKPNPAMFTRKAIYWWCRYFIAFLTVHAAVMICSNIYIYIYIIWVKNILQYIIFVFPGNILRYSGYILPAGQYFFLNIACCRAFLRQRVIFKNIHYIAPLISPYMSTYCQIYIDIKYVSNFSYNFGTKLVSSTNPSHNLWGVDMLLSTIISCGMWLNIHFFTSTSLS